MEVSCRWFLFHSFISLSFRVLPHDLHQSPCKDLILKKYSLEKKNKAEIILHKMYQVCLLPDKEEVVYVIGIIIALTKYSGVECHIVFFMG